MGTSQYVYPFTSFVLLRLAGPSRLGTFMEGMLLQIQSNYSWYTGADKSLSKVNKAAFMDYVRRSGIFDGLDHTWFLRILAVATKFQRQGVGGQLVDWGLEKAKQAEIPVTICASTKGQGLYRKKGFRKLSMLEFPPGGTDLAMLWEPPGMEGHFRAMLSHQPES